ncbi:cysteine desulfurase [Candidatus Berkelbacteria bacterium]|nr:cysteine desulfurase [Candidatus Berkelbacteria bacterium]
MKVKSYFPIFDNQPDLVYLDSAATTQKPQSVIEAIVNYYSKNCSNVHRGMYYLAEQATADYEASRTKVKVFLNAKKDKEIIFTSGTTAALNLVGYAFLAPRLNSGQEIVVSLAEHHSNFVIWQQLAIKNNCRLRVCRLDENYRLDLEHLSQLLTERTALIAINHVSNITGTINPIKAIATLAKRYSIPVVVDGAQAVAHLPVDVADLGVDFYCFSGHKVYGPTGTGILYANEKYLNQMEPWLLGGDMISKVGLDSSAWNEPPYRFEAGTPNVAGVIGLGAAMDFMTSLNWQSIAKREEDLLGQLTSGLASRNLEIFIPESHRSALVSFAVENIHPHDIVSLLAEKNVAARAGFHCAEPFHRAQAKNHGTVRFSLGIYNDQVDVKAGLDALDYALETMRAYA